MTELLKKVGRDGTILRKSFLENQSQPIAVEGKSGVQDFVNVSGTPVKQPKRPKQPKQPPPAIMDELTTKATKAKAPKKGWSYKLSLTGGVPELSDLQKLQAHIIASHQPKSEETAINQAIKEYTAGTKTTKDVEELLGKHKYTEKGRQALSEIEQKRLLNRINNDPNYTLNDARNEFNLRELKPAEIAQIGIIGNLKERSQELVNELQQSRQQTAFEGQQTRGQMAFEAQRARQQARDLSRNEQARVDQLIRATVGEANLTRQQLIDEGRRARQQAKDLSKNERAKVDELIDETIRQATATQLEITQEGLATRGRIATEGQATRQELAKQTLAQQIAADKAISDAEGIRRAIWGAEYRTRGEISRQGQATQQEIRTNMAELLKVARDTLIALSQTRESASTQKLAKSVVEDLREVSKNAGGDVDEFVNDLDLIFDPNITDAQRDALLSKLTDKNIEETVGTTTTTTTTTSAKGKEKVPSKPEPAPEPEGEPEEVEGEIAVKTDTGIKKFEPIDPDEAGVYIAETTKEGVSDTVGSKAMNALLSIAEYVKIGKDSRKFIYWDGKITSSDILDVFILSKFEGRADIIKNNAQQIAQFGKYISEQLTPNPAYTLIKVIDPRTKEDYSIKPSKLTRRAKREQGGQGLKASTKAPAKTPLKKRSAENMSDLESNKKLSVGSSGGVALDTIGGLKLKKSEVVNEAKKRISELTKVKQQQAEQQQLNTGDATTTSSGIILPNNPELNSTINPPKSRGLRFGKSMSSDKATKIMNKCFDIAEGGDPILALDILNGIPEKEYTKKDYVSAYSYIMQFVSNSAI